MAYERSYQVRCVNGECSANGVIRRVRDLVVAPGIAARPAALYCVDCGYAAALYLDPEEERARQRHIEPEQAVAAAPEQAVATRGPRRQAS